MRAGSPWLVKEPSGWRVTAPGWVALLGFLILFVAALVLLHGVTRVFLAPLVLAAFVAFGVGKIDLTRLR